MSRSLVTSTFLALSALLAGCGFFHGGPKLAESDTIVLADFANATGDAGFDGSLNEALAASLGQSPWLNIISPEKVDEALRSLGHSPGDSVAGDLAQKVCRQAGAKAYVSGKISKAGGKFSLTLHAIDCSTGDPLADAESEAATRNDVIHALGDAAGELRGSLGESRASIQKFNLPLEKATSTSPEALKAYGEGRKLTRVKG